MRKAFLYLLALSALVLSVWASPVSADPASDSYEHYFRALELMRTYQYDSARTELLLAIETCPDNPGQLYLELGKLDREARNPSSAATNFLKASRSDPGLLEARYRLADVLLELDRVQEAETVWSGIAAEKPGESEAWIRIAESRGDRNDHSGALDAYKGLLRTDPAHPQALYGFFLLSAGLGDCDGALGLLTNTPPHGLPGLSPVLFTSACLRRQGRTEESLALLRRDWPDFETPSRPVLLSVLAENLYLLDRETECRSVLDELGKNGTPLPTGLSVLRAELTSSDLSNSLIAARILSYNMQENAPAAWALPKILLHMGNREEAYRTLLEIARSSWTEGDRDLCRRALEKASTCAPEGTFEHHFLLSAFLEESGHMKESEKAFADGLAVVPSSCTQRMLKARLLYESHRLKEAYSETLSFLACSASNTAGCFSAALFSLEQGDHEACLFWSRRVLRDDPTSPEANAFAGYALFGLARWSEALKYLETVRRHDDSNHAALFYLGQCLDQLGRDREAIPVLAEAVRLKEDEPAYLNYLGYLMADSGTNLDQAVRFIERALENEPNNPYYLDSLGWTYYRMGRFEEALSEMLKAVSSMEDKGIKEAVIYEHAGDIFQARKERKRALSFWKKALELDPGNPELRKKAR